MEILSNRFIEVQVEPAGGLITLIDKRCARVWRPVLIGDWDKRFKMCKMSKSTDGLTLNADSIDGASCLRLQVSLQLEADTPELVVELNSASEEMITSLAYPRAFVSEAPLYLVTPHGEGLLYPMTDETILPLRLPTYYGHLTSMSFFGLTDLKQGLMAIVETPDDAALQMARTKDFELCIYTDWEASRGNLRYPRRIRYVLFDDGGYVAMAKRYRVYSENVGHVKTLRSKREENPDVDKLIGAPNIWAMAPGIEPVAFCRNLYEKGLRKVLWSVAGGRRNEAGIFLNEINNLDYLTSTYDAYNDLLPPEARTRPASPYDGWPNDVRLGPDGKSVRGWVFEDTPIGPYACHQSCSVPVIDKARRKISEDLRERPYNARFIDIITAQPFLECYHPDHPVTRGEDREYKTETLRMISEDLGLITGAEAGIDPVVPYVHYFEGMMSLSAYRVVDAGADLLQLHAPSKEMLKFQVGHYYRIPLWELVYHDCVVSYWYWGDYNNKVPDVWDKRDLFNVLYGTPPMWVFNDEIWARFETRFIQCYHQVCPIVEKVGYEEMLSHELLNDEHTIQKTVFTNGLAVYANFSDYEQEIEGMKITPCGYVVSMNEYTK